MYDDMENRLPKGGALSKAYAYGHILHPVYRGLILSDLKLTTETLELFVADNETAEEDNEVQADALNQGVIEIDIDNEDDYILAHSDKVNNSRLKLLHSHFSPLKHPSRLRLQGI